MDFRVAFPKLNTSGRGITKMFFELELGSGQGQDFKPALIIRNMGYTVNDRGPYVLMPSAPRRLKEDAPSIFDGNGAALNAGQAMRFAIDGTTNRAIYDEVVSYKRDGFGPDAQMFPQSVEFRTALTAACERAYAKLTGEPVPERATTSAAPARAGASPFPERRAAPAPQATTVVESEDDDDDETGLPF